MTGTEASPSNVALFESAKKELVDSVDVLRRFSQSMITLSTAFIPTYLAVLKFVEIDEKAISTAWKIVMSVISPLPFLFSCTFFIVTYF